MKEINFVITITDRKQAEGFISIFKEHNLPVILGTFGKGTASREVLDYLGLEASEKAVLFNLATRDRAHELIRDVRRHMRIDLPGNGIMLAVPVSSIGGGQLAKCLCEESENGPEGKGCEKKVGEAMDYQLIIAIANEGYTDMVMDAARSAGARGGTSVHAKGIGLESAKKFFGVSIASEKELVFIVARSSEKTPIMKAIIHDAGTQTKAGAVVFSLPVTEVGGLSALELDEEE
ncbi:MAG: P-II family nitrogen regulator [Clostridiales bacterium]|nr:P-II family nitrogen regulator [Clostridiales bacterium]